MNKKLLSCALLGAMSLAQSAMAQEFDDRWYVTGTTGLLVTDDSRNSNNDISYGLGFGRFFSPRVSVDLELERSSFERDSSNLDWDLTSAALVGRYHFITEGRNWWPYLAAGVGTQYHNQEFVGMLKSRTDTNLAVKYGAGLQADYDRWAVRVELGQRWDADDTSIGTGNSDSLLDTYVNLTAVFKLGSKPEAPVAPPPAPPAAPAKTCADLDDDGDGVNNCNDKCPASQAGQAIGPDGCPVPLTIDLKGVNFDFDKATLRPDAITILDEAASILQKYPQLRVEVAGHTDAVGAENYNQGLSERRARAVYDYLVGKGIDASRMVGPTGYGEARPIDSNDTAEGRARNRRTELNVQN